jgi:hypothetical protein
MEAPSDRWQGDVDDGGVEHDNELGEGEEH